MGRSDRRYPSLAYKLIIIINKATNMKRNVLFSATLAFLLAASLAFSPSAHAQIGISGGLNFNQLDDISATNANATYESSTGYHVGVFYDLGLGPIAVRPGVMYRQVGTYEFGDIPGVGEEVDIELNAVEVPIDVRWRVLPLPLVKPYVLAGPVLTFPQSSEDFGSTKSVNLNADIGAGVEITLPGVGLTLMPELRYGIATGSILEDEFEIGDVEVDPQDNPRLNSIMLRLNVRF